MDSQEDSANARAHVGYFMGVCWDQESVNKESPLFYDSKLWDQLSILCEMPAWDYLK